jgi:hypothetical protein
MKHRVARPYALSLAPNTRRSRHWRLSVLAAAVSILASAAHASPRFIAIDRDLNQRTVRVAGIDGDRIYVLRDDATGRVQSLPLDAFIALLSPEAAGGGTVQPPPGRTNVSLLQLGDGQRFPGQAPFRSRTERDELHWHHAWLGSLAVPLAEIEWITFRSYSGTRSRTSRPGEFGQPPPAARESDLVMLANGDVLEGFLHAISDPLVLEMEIDGRTRELEIPIGRVAAVAIITQPSEPTGRRLWLTDGTIVDVEQLVIAEDGHARVKSRWSMDGQPARVAATEIAGVLLTGPADQRMTPLAALDVVRIDGPVTRYEIPEPRLIDETAVLGLSPVEFRGPLTVEFALPPGARRFAATAELPPDSRLWGDYELVLRSGGEEILRRLMNAAEPTIEINIELPAADLVIEMTDGAHGPIQDRLILHRAMILAER